MRAFEVYVNRKKICVAGIGDEGVLSAIIGYSAGHGWDHAYLHTGGMVGSEEHVRWKWLDLKTGDEVRVKIVETDVIDRPKERFPRDEKKDLASIKRDVRKKAREFGWEIVAKPARKRRP